MAPTRYRAQGRHNGSGSSHMWTSPGVTASLRSVANSLLLPTSIPPNRLPIPGEMISEKALSPLTVAGDQPH